MSTILRSGQQKILKELRKGPLHLRELARRTELNPHSVSRYLNQFEQAQIVKKTPIANITQYSLTETPTTKALTRYLDALAFQALPRERKQAVTIILDTLKPIKAIVFGSTAANTHTKNSDLDILVVTTKKDFKTLQTHVYAQTGINAHIFGVTEEDYFSSDPVINSAKHTGLHITV